MGKINREITAKPTIDGNSWWLPKARAGFTAECVKVFAVEEPPSPLNSVMWLQMATWDSTRERRSA